MKHVKLFEQFIAEAKYTNLDSVGSVMDKDGIIYPQFQDGTPDLDGGVELSEIDLEDDWYTSLDKKDKKIVDQMMKKLGISEGFGGFSNVSSNKKLDDLTNDMVDVLSNSMEHYDEDTFMDAADEFGYDAETMKKIFNDYWSLDAKKRMKFNDADWKKWLKSYN